MFRSPSTPNKSEINSDNWIQLRSAKSPTNSQIHPENLSRPFSQDAKQIKIYIREIEYCSVPPHRQTNHKNIVVIA